MGRDTLLEVGLAYMSGAHFTDIGGPANGTPITSSSKSNTGADTEPAVEEASDEDVEAGLTPETARFVVESGGITNPTKLVVAPTEDFDLPVWIAFQNSFIERLGQVRAFGYLNRSQGWLALHPKACNKLADYFLH